MAQCKVFTEGRTFQKSLKILQKKFRAIDRDLEKHIDKIQADFKSVCNAFCVPMPGIPELQNRIWKYDIGSTDLKKPSRECFRLIGILDAVNTPLPTMSAVIIYHKSEQSNINPKQIKELYDSLQESSQE